MQYVVKIEEHHENNPRKSWCQSFCSRFVLVKTARCTLYENVYGVRPTVAKVGSASPRREYGDGFKEKAGSRSRKLGCFVKRETTQDQ